MRRDLSTLIRCIPRSLFGRLILQNFENTKNLITPYIVKATKSLFRLEFSVIPNRRFFTLVNQVQEKVRDDKVRLHRRNRFHELQKPRRRRTDFLDVELSVMIGIIN